MIIQRLTLQRSLLWNQLWNQPIVLAFRNCKFRKSESIDPNVKIAAVIVVVSIIIGGFASYGLAVHFGEQWPEPIHNLLRWVSLLTAFNFAQIKSSESGGVLAEQ